MRTRPLTAVLATVLPVVAALVLASGASAQTTAANCGYGTAGPFASNLCWFDMTNYSDASARSAGGQAMSINLPGGYVASFTVTSRPVAGVANHQNVAPFATPIENRFAFGSTGADGGYRNVPGKPALYSGGGAGGVVLTLSNIQVRDSAGQPVTGYRFVVADAENNVAGENFTWNSDKPLDLIGVLNDDALAGCNVPPGLAGIGTTTVTCTGRGGDAGVDPKYDAVVVGSDTPSTIGLSMTTFARSGVAFGVLTSKIEVRKSVAGRIRSTDSFDVKATSPEGSTVGSATTGSTNAATTGELTVLPRTTGASYTLSEAATPGSGTQQGDYTRSWSCTNNDQPDPSLPSGGDASITVSPEAGDDILCTATNTQVPAEPVSCTSDPNVFNTGYDAATGGILANGSNDVNWKVAGPFPPTSPASLAQPPPAGAVFGNAVVGNQAPGFWAPSPYGNAQWISQPGTGSSNGDWYYRFQFNLDPAVDPSTFSLKMNFLADNDVAEVYVNGTAQSGQTTGIPQNTTDPYHYAGFQLANAAQTTLNHDWRTGLNTVVVQVKSFATAEGFDAQLVPSAICPVDLAITKSASPSPYSPGQPLTYTVKVTNGGPGTASGLSVTDPLPGPLSSAGFTWTCTPTAGSSCKPSGTGDISDVPSGSYPGPSIKPAGTLTYTVTGTVPLSATGALSNTATLTPGPGTVDPGCTPSCTGSTNTPSVPVSDLRLSKSASPNTVNPLEQSIYTLTATNDGPNDEPAALITDTLPSGVSYVSDDSGCGPPTGQQLTCTLGAMAAGSSKTVHVTVAAGLLSGNTTQHNTATVSGQNLDPNPQNNDAAADLFVRQAADLKLEKSAAPSTINPNDTTTYELKITNNGPDSPLLETVTDTLPAGVTYVSNDRGCPAPTGQQFACTLLLPGATETIHITVTANPGPGRTETNTASVSSPLGDPDPSNNSDDADVLVLPLSDLSITKDGPANARAGQSIDYTLMVANGGPSDDTNVVVTDTPPAGVTITNVSGSGCSALPCTIPTLAAGANATVTVTAQIDPATRGEITNSASVDGDNNDQDPGNNSDDAKTQVSAPLTDLAIDKSVSPETADPGPPNNQVAYALKVTNNGPDLSTSETITDLVPPGVTYTSNDAAGIAGASCDTSNLPQVTCTLPSLPAGSSQTIHINATVDPSSAGSVIDNTASVTGPGDDTSPGNNSDDARLQVTPLSDLSITKDAPATARAGQNIDYTLGYANGGPSSSNNTTITDTLPTGVTYVSDDAGCDVTNLPQITCDVGSVASGGSGTVHISVGIDPATRGQITNTASISGSNNDSDLSDNEDDADTQVSAQLTDLAIQKDVSPTTADPVAPNNQVTYTLTVTNEGPDATPSARVTDSLPSGLTYVSDDAGCDVSNLPQITCDLSSPIANNGSRAIHINATVNSSAGGATIINTASVTGPGDDTDQNDNSDDAQLQVRALSDLSLTKDVDATAVTAGDDLTYTLSYSNGGPSASNATIVTDTLPAGVSYVSDDASCDTTNLPQVSCTIGSLASGANGVIHITVHVDPSTQGPVQNTASIDGPNDDQDPSDDSDDATTQVSPAAVPPENPPSDEQQNQTPPPTAGKTSKCFFGHTVTILGTRAPERILGTDGRDVINGKGGNDVIIGLDGNDLICGGAGDDLIIGGNGNDRVKGSTGDDRIRGNLGDDWLRGAPGNDRISGRQGNDRLMGNNGDDRLWGRQGNDFLLGGPGQDRGSGGPGVDSATAGTERAFGVEG